MSEPTLIARCSAHGLQLTTGCFECGGPVERVEVVLLPKPAQEAASFGFDNTMLRDRSIAVACLQHGFSLQAAADYIGMRIQASDEAAKLDRHGPGPTVPGPGFGPIER